MAEEDWCELPPEVEQRLTQVYARTYSATRGSLGDRRLKAANGAAIPSFRATEHPKIVRRFLHWLRGSR